MSPNTNKNGDTKNGGSRGLLITPYTRDKGACTSYPQMMLVSLTKQSRQKYIICFLVLQGYLEKNFEAKRQAFMIKYRILWGKLGLMGFLGAERGTRTLTGLRPTAPQTVAYTNSAISAYRKT